MSHIPTGDAQILDRGYRHFRGERTGVAGAVRTLAIHSFQRALGLRRNLWAKALPLPAVLIAYLPAIVFVGVVALFPVEDVPTDFLPSYGDYYGFVIAAIMLFVAFVAPEVLCTDRRSGMLGVYLSSPLDRDTYLLGKAIAIATALSLVCLGPPLLLLLANVLQSQGPDGAGDILLALVRVVVAGVVLTVFYTGVTMGVASLTDRKTVATAGIILIFLVSIMVTGILSVSGAPEGSQAVSPTYLSLDLASRVHGEPGNIMPSASSALVWGAWLAWTVGGFALARFRLHAVQVSR
jgi:ABC-2 type transport system permease protein